MKTNKERVENIRKIQEKMKQYESYNSESTQFMIHELEQKIEHLNRRLRKQELENANRKQPKVERRKENPYKRRGMAVFGRRVSSV